MSDEALVNGRDQVPTSQTKSLIALCVQLWPGGCWLATSILTCFRAWPSPWSGLPVWGRSAPPSVGSGRPCRPSPGSAGVRPLPSPSSGSRARVQESTVGNHVGSRPFCAKAKFTVSCTTCCEKVVRKTTGEQARLLRNPTDFKTTLTIS